MHSIFQLPHGNDERKGKAVSYCFSVHRITERETKNEVVTNRSIYNDVWIYSGYSAMIGDGFFLCFLTL